MLKAVILDAYGTLIDTKEDSVKATETISNKNYCDLDPKLVYREWKKYHAKHIKSYQHL